MLVVNLTDEVVAQGSIRGVPVSKPNTVVLWVSAEVNDQLESHHDQSYQGDDLDTAEPELKLSEDADSHHVDREY